VSRAAAAVRALVDARPRSGGPVVVGIAGGVASGKSRLAEELRAALGPASVDVVSTDGFLFPNAVLAERGLVSRKGFPESYDVAALRAFVGAAREGGLPRRVPCYSHRRYDVDGDREVPAVDVLVVEGVNVLAAAPDLLDVAVYVDVDEALLEDWFRRRFRDLCAAGRDDPRSFYRSLAALDDEALMALAGRAWRGVNLVNLREHVAPSRRHADVVITKGADHVVLDVVVRDDGRHPLQEP
jgi:type I pantothenate kinase